MDEDVGYITMKKKTVTYEKDMSNCLILLIKIIKYFGALKLGKVEDYDIYYDLLDFCKNDENQDTSLRDAPDDVYELVGSRISGSSFSLLDKK